MIHALSRCSHLLYDQPSFVVYIERHPQALEVTMELARKPGGFFAPRWLLMLLPLLLLSLTDRGSTLRFRDTVHTKGRSK